MDGAPVAKSNGSKPPKRAPSAHESTDSEDSEPGGSALNQILPLYSSSTCYDSANESSLFRDLIISFKF